MRHWLLVVSLFLLASAARAETIRGTWRIAENSRGVHLELTREHMQFGHSMPFDAFRGLDPSVLHASTETPAHFQLVRDAGTIDFTGTFSDGEGVGRFTFVPDNGFADRLRGLGVTPTDITDERLFRLTAMDVSASFIRDMRSLGYRESLDRYTTFRIHGVTPDFARELRDLGVRGLSSDSVVAMRIHGVHPEFVRELGELGYRNLTSDELVAMRIHGVSTKFIRELAGAGYHGIPVEKLVSMRIHGIDSDFVRHVK